MTNNTSIIQTIRDLRAKAESSGSTEAEAMQCAAMAARLMAKNELSEDDLHRAAQSGKNGAGRERVEQPTRRVDPRAVSIHLLSFRFRRSCA